MEEVCRLEMLWQLELALCCRDIDPDEYSLGVMCNSLGFGPVHSPKNELCLVEIKHFQGRRSRSGQSDYGLTTFHMLKNSFLVVVASLQQIILYIQQVLSFSKPSCIPPDSPKFSNSQIFRSNNHYPMTALPWRAKFEFPALETKFEATPYNVNHNAC